jgi:hypothetical protein
VSDTEVKLASQDETAEKFRSNILSRSIVEFSVKLSGTFSKILPAPLKEKINKQFTPLVAADDSDAPAFDLVQSFCQYGCCQYVDCSWHIFESFLSPQPM